MTLLPVAASIFMSFFSAILVLGNTAEMYLHGAQFYLQIFSKGIGFLAAAFIVAPILYPLKLTSSYQVLFFVKKRFKCAEKNRRHVGVAKRPFTVGSRPDSTGSSVSFAGASSPNIFQYFNLRFNSKLPRVVADIGFMLTVVSSTLQLKPSGCSCFVLHFLSLPAGQNNKRTTLVNIHGRFSTVASPCTPRPLHWKEVITRGLYKLSFPWPDFFGSFWKLPDLLGR